MNHTITLQSLIKQRDGLPSQRLDDDLVMVDFESGKYYGLAQTGMRIWELLAKPRTVAELCARLQAEFVVAPAECEQQTLDFLGVMQREGLIEVVP